MFTKFEITTLDLSILIGYLILSKVIPLWLTRKQGNNSDRSRAAQGKGEL